jgi:hypothetical protein
VTLHEHLKLEAVLPLRRNRVQYVIRQGYRSADAPCALHPSRAQRAGRRCAARFAGPLARPQTVPSSSMLQSIATAVALAGLRCTCIVESNRTQFTPSGMQNRAFGPYLTINNRISIPGMSTAQVCVAVKWRRLGRSRPLLSLACRSHCRYCEFNQRLDATRQASWNKFTAIMSVLQCSDYLLWLDAGEKQGTPQLSAVQRGRR